MSTEAAGGAPISFDQRDGAAPEDASTEASAASVYLGLAIAVGLTALAAITGLLLSAAVFGYTVTELL